MLFQRVTSNEWILTSKEQRVKRYASHKGKGKNQRILFRYDAQLQHFTSSYISKQIATNPFNKQNPWLKIAVFDWFIKDVNRDGNCDITLLRIKRLGIYNYIENWKRQTTTAHLKRPPVIAVMIFFLILIIPNI